MRTGYIKVTYDDMKETNKTLHLFNSCCHNGRILPNKMQTRCPCDVTNLTYIVKFSAAVYDRSFQFWI